MKISDINLFILVTFVPDFFGLATERKKKKT
jgi:hypothetical protein